MYFTTWQGLFPLRWVLKSNGKYNEWISEKIDNLPKGIKLIKKAPASFIVTIGKILWFYGSMLEHELLKEEEDDTITVS